MRDTVEARVFEGCTEDFRGNREALDGRSTTRPGMANPSEASPT